MASSTERLDVMPHAAARVDTVAARWFYCDVLRGRQVWPGDCAAGGGLWFQVGDGVVAVYAEPRGVAAPALLVVDDPIGLAERCWDAGLTVWVREAASREMTLVVTDPFGRQLVLCPREREEPG